MILAVLFFLMQVIFGFWVFDFFDQEKKFGIPEKITTAFVLGLLISGFVILISSLIFKSLYLGAISFAIIFFIVLAVKIKSAKDFFGQIGSIKQKIDSKNIFNPRNLWIVFIALLLSVYCFLLRKKILDWICF